MIVRNMIGWAMVKKRKVELYDILANRLSESSEADLSGSGDPLLVSRRLPQRTGREIILSLEGAFVIFFVVLLLIGTGFYLGFRKGLAEAEEKFNRSSAYDIPRSNSSENITLIGENPSRLRPEVTIAPGKFTLKVLGLDKNSRNFEKMRKLRLDLLASPIIKSNPLGVFIIGNDKNYSLVVGLYDRRDDDILVNLRQYFKENGSKVIPGFKGLSVENVEDLGKPLE